jgi:UDP-N-acetylmuramoylalanine-D-glutamate ligase
MQSEVRHESFERYVTDNLPTGLGTTIRFLKNLCRDDDEALEAIDAATKHKPGGGKNQHTKQNSLVDNINEATRPTGTSRDAAIRRLRKDRPDLLEKVIAGQLSAHAAACEAGFRKKPSAAEKCVKEFRKAENRMEVLRMIASELEPHEAAVVRDWITERMN